MAQCLGYRIPHHAEHILAILETQLHLRWMDIHIQKLRLNLKMQHRKRILVLHHEGLVRLLNGLVDDVALDISSINIVIFKIPVTPGDDRLPNKAFYAEGFSGNRHWDQVGRNLPPVNRINDIF